MADNYKTCSKLDSCSFLNFDLNTVVVKTSEA